MADVIDFKTRKRELLYGTDEERVAGLPRRDFVEGYEDENFCELLFLQEAEVLKRDLYSEHARLRRQERDRGGSSTKGERGSHLSRKK